METNFQNAIIISLVGFISVVIILSVYALIIAALNKLNAIVSIKKQITKPQTSIDIESIEKSNIDDEICVLITAAVTTIMNEKIMNEKTTMSEKILIRKISFLQNSSPNTVWNNIHKTTNFQLHNINIQNRR